MLGNWYRLETIGSCVTFKAAGSAPRRSENCHLQICEGRTAALLPNRNFRSIFSQHCGGLAPMTVKEGHSKLEHELESRLASERKDPRAQHTGIERGRKRWQAMLARLIRERPARASSYSIMPGAP